MSSKPLIAGPELDAAVARALGWDFTIDMYGSVILLESHGENVACGLFNPSTSIELAMSAAEAFELFDHSDGDIAIIPHWEIVELIGLPYAPDERETIADGRTLPEALSRAIVARSRTRKK
jgi:hypothetical protein